MHQSMIACAVFCNYCTCMYTTTSNTVERLRVKLSAVHTFASGESRHVTDVKNRRINNASASVKSGELHASR